MGLITEIYKTLPDVNPFKVLSEVVELIENEDLQVVHELVRQKELDYVIESAVKLLETLVEMDFIDTQDDHPITTPGAVLSGKDASVQSKEGNIEQTPNEAPEPDSKLISVLKSLSKGSDGDGKVVPANPVPEKTIS